MRKVQFATDEYYHIFSRTLSHVPIFKDKANSERLKQAFWVANSTNSNLAFQFLRNNQGVQMEDVLEIVRDGKKLVDVLCYSIMPDHYHLLLREREEKGISEFVRKCNISISKYNNIKNERKGPIFESRFNSKYIDTNKYLLHLSCYINLNPLDILVDRSWRKHGLRNWSLAREKLLSYPWSSAKFFLKDDNDNNNFIVSGTDVLLGQFDNSKRDYELFLRDWSEESLESIKDYV